MRASAADIGAAFDAAFDGRSRAEAWDARAQALAPIARQLEAVSAARPGLANELEAALGLDADEPCPALVPTPEELAVALQPSFGVGLGDGVADEVVLVLAHWSEGLRGLARRVLTALAGGAGVVILSDPRLPLAADALARAVAAAPERARRATGAGALSVLHDDGLTVLRAAGALASERPLALWGLAADPRLAAAGGAFERVIREPSYARSLVVGARDDIRRAAREAVLQACGRSATLSGQLSGRIGRVLCHELRFSEFTNELLIELDDAETSRPPLPLVDESIERTLLEARALGLDEGACLIAGGEPSARTASGSFRYGLAVFTNVDPSRSLVRQSSPCPLLSLVRVPSEAVGQRLARELDSPAAGSSAGPAPRGAR